MDHLYVMKGVDVGSIASSRTQIDIEVTTANGPWPLGWGLFIFLLGKRSGALNHAFFAYILRSFAKLATSRIFPIMGDVH